MMHPDTQVRWIDDGIGYGVYATAAIPKGTIVYVQDALDIVLAPDSPLLQDPRYRAALDKYAVIDGSGNRVICWDIGKYVNHCCHYNTLSTGWGFEIAVREIQAGEELTDDYGLFGFTEEMALCGHYADCRRKLRADDFERYSGEWDEAVQAALGTSLSVVQPLLLFLAAEVYDDLMRYLTTGQGYRSVQCLRVEQLGGRIGQSHFDPCW